MERNSYSFLIIGSALIGAALDVVLSLLDIAAPAAYGAVGCALVLWIGAWSNLRSKQAGIQKTCP